MWSSGNPWKPSSWRLETVSSTREELNSLVSSIKKAQPPVQPKTKRSKNEAEHDALMKKLDAHIPLVDEELHRIDLSIKRIQAKETARLRAAELIMMRETRTRAKKRVDYAAVEKGNTGSGEEDGDDVSRSHPSF